MHELSIAVAIVESAEEEAQRHGGRVDAVHVKVGALSGVVKDALLFSWDLACADTSLAGARLEIEEIPVRLWCAACGEERNPAGDFDLRCAVCGGTDTEVRRGRELELAALEIRDTEDQGQKGLQSQ